MLQMNSISIISVFLLFSALFSTEVAAQQRNSTISLNSFLSPNANISSWFSSSGRFAFGFYPEGDGFAVGIWLTTTPDKTLVWTANRDKPKVSSDAGLLFTSDGLILRPAQGEDITISALAGRLASSASMQNTGNFVLYDSDSKVIWQSFDSPTDSLLPGQRLLPGMEMYSSASETDHSKGRFLLIMQLDGYLVQYPALAPFTIQYGYWDSGGAGANATLHLDDGGKLYIRNSTGSVAKTLSADKGNESMYRLTVDADGFFRLYSHAYTRNENWTVVWAPTKYDACVPKGLCGSNAYCTLMDQEASCHCLPGFGFVDQGQRTLGCEREVSIASCRSMREEDLLYNMSTLERTDWTEAVVNAYSVATSTTEDECKEACRVDCNCEAAIFDDPVCRKQKMPLRFGRRALDGSAKTAFIKVASSDVTVETRRAPSKDRKKDVLIYILIAIVCFVTFSFATLGMFSFLLYKRGASAYKKILEQPSTILGMEMPLRSFTYEELEKATDNFKVVLGRGSFGTVSKGKLSNSSQTIIAVKRLEARMVNEGEKEFLAEMRTIGRTHHRNLVQLLGYCHQGSNRLLVYEYMINGSLADFLFKCEQRPAWNVRVEIARSVARGILYLHEECANQIIHCDLKPQNILMDQNKCPKIADFGLAKLLKQDQTKTLTAMRGTRGYIAPEWYRSFPVTVKADVYSFGIVLLEIICCRGALNMELVENEVVLVDWVSECLYGGKLDELVTDENVNMKIFERMAIVALWCIQDEPSLRPCMKNVVLMLEGTIDIPNPPKLLELSL